MPETHTTNLLSTDDNYDTALHLVVDAMADELSVVANGGDTEIVRTWINAEVLREALKLGVEAFETAWLAEMLRSGLRAAPEEDWPCVPLHRACDRPS